MTDVAALSFDESASKSNGNKTDQKTVAKYLKGLTDSLVLYSAPRYNVRGRQLLTTNGKYYAVGRERVGDFFNRGSASDVME